MKKSLIGLLLVVYVNFAYGEPLKNNNEIQTIGQEKKITVSTNEEDEQPVIKKVVMGNSEEFIKKGVDSTPEIVAIWQHIMELEAKMGQPLSKEELKELYEQYELELNNYINSIKYDTDKLFMLGDYYFKDRRYERALTIFSLDNTNIKNLFGAATTARFLKKTNKALGYYNAAIKLVPNFYESYLGRGILYRNEGQYTEAIADFQKYLTFKETASVYIGLGTCYIALKEYENAKNVLEIGRAKFPESETIKQLLMRVYARQK